MSLGIPQVIEPDWMTGSDMVPSTDYAVEDSVLRRLAMPFRELDDTVVTSPKGHEGRSTVCHVCGSGSWTISHCGRPLCLPCQGKKASRYYPIINKALIAGQTLMDRRLKDTNIRYEYRFVTVTIKSVPDGHLNRAVRKASKAWQNLRRSVFWTVQCDVLGDIPRLEITYSQTEGWHVHIHSIVASKFMPAGELFNPLRSVGDFDPKHPENLTDQWHALTGDSIIVKIGSVKDAASLTRELVKYIFKPTDDKEMGISSWPASARRELAETLAGPYRIVWFCPSHHSRKRQECLDYESPNGHTRVRCEGEYRLERQGFHPLTPSGIFRTDATRQGLISAAKEEEPDKPSCHQCGLGELRGRRYWEDIQRYYGCDNSNASIALNLIPEHQVAGGTTRTPLDLHYHMPSSWKPPPEYENFKPWMRQHVVDMVRHHAQDELEITEVWHSLFPEDPDDVPMLNIKSLSNLHVLERDSKTGYYRVNEPMLARLSGGE